MKDSHIVGSVQLLLGCSFLKTANTNINMTDKNLIIEFDRDIIKFSVFDEFKNLMTINLYLLLIW